MSTFRVVVFLLIWVISLMPIAQAKKGPGSDGKLPQEQDYAIATPAARGKVGRLLINPFGEIDGVLLDTGVVVTFPKHMSEQLAAAIKPGDSVEVKGYNETPGQIKGYVISNLGSAESLVIQPRPPGGSVELPRHSDSAGLRAMSAQGEIRHLLYGKRGEINGLILEKGVVVRLSREAVDQFQSILKIGQAISASGYGTKNEYGAAFEATALGRAGQTPQPVSRR